LSAFFYFFANGAFIDAEPVGGSFSVFLPMMLFQEASIAICTEQCLYLGKDFITRQSIPAFPSWL
jgi:hypothetical protein